MCWFAGIVLIFFAIIALDYRVNIKKKTCIGMDFVLKENTRLRDMNELLIKQIAEIKRKAYDKGIVL